MMKALVVGAGAVGQVFARHLQLGGAEVSFLVKPKYVDECKRGYVLYPLQKKPYAPVRLDGCGCLTAPEGGFDQVYITVAGPALRAGTWLADLARAVGDATIVVLQPGPSDRATVVAHFPEERIVDGGIAFLSYHAPLPDETRFTEPGMAYWFFPGASPFSGPRADAVVAALRAGKLPAKRVADVPKTAGFASATLSGFINALEAAGWSLAAMRKDSAAIGARAAREAQGVIAHERGTRPPFAARLLARPLGFRLVTRLAPRFVPVDLETYLRVHFTKVGQQMHENLATYLARAQQAGLPSAALGELSRRLES